MRLGRGKPHTVACSRESCSPLRPQGPRVPHENLRGTELADRWALQRAAVWSDVNTGVTGTKSSHEQISWKTAHPLGFLGEPAIHLCLTKCRPNAQDVGSFFTPLGRLCLRNTDLGTDGWSNHLRERHSPIMETEVQKEARPGAEETRDGDRWPGSVAPDYRPRSSVSMLPLCE